VAVAVAGVILSMAAAGRARADTVESPGSFPVKFEGSAPGVTVRIVGAGVDIPCGESCVVDLEPAEYTLKATRPDGRGSARKVSILGSARVTVAPHNHTARVVGFVLMPVGAATLAVAVVTAWWVGMSPVVGGCGSDCDDYPSWLVPGANIAVLAGGVVALTGAFLWRLNTDAGVTVSEFSGRRRSGAGPRLTPVGGPHWSGLALSGSF
jgi:hypothetical protein